MLTWINPLGYVGGDADDWQYLRAVRCAAEHGYCLPGDHWARRFPIVAPSALMFALFGESARILWIVPALYGSAALCLFALMVERQFGRPAAWIASLAFVLTPVFTDRFLQLGINVPELALVLAAVFSVQSFDRSGSRWKLLAAGTFLALAVQSRPTVLAALPMFLAAMMLLPGARRCAHWFFIGFAAPLAIEAVAYAWAAGDALLSWKLSLAHASIPSTALQPGAPLTGSPIFNIALIDGWGPVADIPLHWSVEGVVNLLVHPAIGFSLLCALVLLLLNRSHLGKPEAGGRALLFLVGSAVLYCGALIYCFAIDPTPRMFIPVAAVACACIGVLSVNGWRSGHRAIVAACLALIAANGLTAPFKRASFAGAGAVALVWVAAERDEIAVGAWTARLLTLTPAIAALPIHDGGTAKLLLRAGTKDCAKVASAMGSNGWAVVREHRFDRQEPAIIAFLRRRDVLLGPKVIPVLCLLRPADVRR